ncbi:hypothetical protein OG762_49560 (plasmid) [Streptomyces sp. NBC_01136]|uniref:hypothetical protein n=1 Tax=unclassified Streptomyces TaxID=2593676 RepID=UPI002F90B3B9|nr:hypothetical protein OG762_49560 [Streptomyces sp. NBC_01136]
MSSLIEELHRREAAAREEVAGIRREIGLLNERLAVAEERLSRLEIARETVSEILGGAGTDQSVAGPVADAVVTAGPGPSSAVVAPASPIGVLTVPPWRPGIAVSVLPRAYQDIVEVLVDAGQPLRAAQVAAAAGLSTDKSKVEGLRSKLKRLVERGWLFEDGPGRFTPAGREGGVES